MAVDQSKLSRWRLRIRRSGRNAALSMLLTLLCFLRLPLLGTFLGVGAAAGVIGFLSTVLEAHTQRRIMLYVAVVLGIGGSWAIDTLVPKGSSIPEWLVLLQFLGMMCAVWDSLVFVFRDYLSKKFERAPAA
jgi:hypothetical protein